MSAGVRSLHPYQNFRLVRDPGAVWIVSTLPQPYQRFYREWMGSETKEAPVHWKAKEEEWYRDPDTGEVKRHQNVPVKVVYPDQMHGGLWGGEGVIEGTFKKGRYRSPVPRFWVPTFYKAVVYSQVLDKYMSVVVTERALKLIDECQGLDNYLLKTPAYDLKSLLACKLKRKLFLTLMDKDFSHNDLTKQATLYDQFKDYLIPREDAEWYGYSVQEAQAKHNILLKEQGRTSALKHGIRSGYYSEWKSGTGESISEEATESKSWVKKLNPFSKPAGV